MQTVEIDRVGDKVRQSVKWSIFAQIIQKIFFLGCSVILARILSPEDFGLASMCITLDAITWIVLSLGIISALLHYQDNVEARLNAAFWIILTSSSLLVLAQILVAPFIAEFYKEPLLVPIVRTSAIGLLITSFGSVQRTILAKNLDFKKISILETVINTLRNLLYVIFALLGFKVWSFVYPKIIVAIISAISLWSVTKWRPSFKLNLEYWREMLSFGKNVLFSNIIDYVLNNSGYILIGNLLGASMLGIYSFAYDKSMLVVNSISAPVANITFPTFAKLQSHPEKLKEAFLKTIKSITIITFPFAIFQIVAGKEFITGIFGAKWSASVVIFQIIVLFSIVRSISQCSNPILQAIGRPDIALKWNLIYAPLYMGSIFFGYYLGKLLGIGILTTLVGVLGGIFYVTIVTKVLNWKLYDVYSAIQPALFSSVLMGLSLILIKPLLLSLVQSTLLNLFLLLISGIVVYLLAIKILFNNTFEFVKITVLKLVKINKVNELPVTSN